MKIHLLNLTLMSLLFFYTSFHASLKTKIYLCIDKNKITYWSRTRPEIPFLGNCFYTGKYTNVEYSKYKNLLSKQP